MALSKGDIILVQFPFSDLSKTKLRPALVLAVGTNIDEITVCFVSSQKVSSLNFNEFAILKSDSEFAQTGLKSDSKVRVTRIITLERNLILRRIGRLGEKQTITLDRTLIQAFGLNNV